MNTQKSTLLALLSPSARARLEGARLPAVGLASTLADRSVIDAIGGAVMQAMDVDGDAMASFLMPHMEKQIIPHVESWISRYGSRYGIGGPRSGVDVKHEGVKGLQPVFLGYGAIVGTAITWVLNSLAGATTLYDSRLYFDDPDGELSYITTITLAGSNIWTRQGTIAGVTANWVCAAARYRLQHPNYFVGDGMHLGKLPVSNNSTLTIVGVGYTGIPGATQIGAWIDCIPRKGDFNLSADECACEV